MCITNLTVLIVAFTFWLFILYVVWIAISLALICADGHVGMWSGILSSSWSWPLLLQPVSHDINNGFKYMHPSGGDVWYFTGSIVLTNDGHECACSHRCLLITLLSVYSSPYISPSNSVALSLQGNWGDSWDDGELSGSRWNRGGGGWGGEQPLLLQDQPLSAGGDPAAVRGLQQQLLLRRWNQNQCLFFCLIYATS